MGDRNWTSRSRASILRRRVSFSASRSWVRASGNKGPSSWTNFDQVSFGAMGQEDKCIEARSEGWLGSSLLMP